MSDEIFDPEIHATDKDGNPSLNKDGSFRKKRKDAGRRGKADGPRPASPAGRVAADQRARYHKAVSDFTAVPVAGLSMVDPVMGYAAGALAPAWSDALADLAMEQPRLAAALERAGGLGAVGAVAMVGVMTVVQFGTLAGKVPEHVAKGFGLKTRSEIEQILRQRGAQLAAAAEERRRQDAEDAAEAEEMARVAREGRGEAVSHEYAEAV